jgi:hypothetical protein
VGVGCGGNAPSAVCAPTAPTVTPSKRMGHAKELKFPRTPQGGPPRTGSLREPPQGGPPCGVFPSTGSRNCYPCLCSKCYPCLFPLPTPALSPLRGDGARRASSVRARVIAALAAVFRQFRRVLTGQDAATDKPIAARVQRDSLSPQRGEGRGEG